jgi:hypothetical protein
LTPAAVAQDVLHFAHDMKKNFQQFYSSTKRLELTNEHKENKITLWVVLKVQRGLVDLKNAFSSQGKSGYALRT